MNSTACLLACNEEQTILPLLHAVCAARPLGLPFSRITVVSSACTDRTEDIVREQAARDPRLALLSEPARRGKAAAINSFLAACPADGALVFISSGDVLPRPGCIDALAETFHDPAVGMTGGRPLPQNPQTGLLHRMVHLLWHLHHHMALAQPKIGECFFVRQSLLQPLPEETLVDEAWIEREVLRLGRRLAYVPDAIVENLGPSRWNEWFSQRIRIARGHLWLRRLHGHTVSTHHPGTLLRVLASQVLPHPSRWLPFLALAACESLCPLRARLDGVSGKHRTAVWDLARSTKTGWTPPSSPSAS